MRYGLPYKGSKNAIAEKLINHLPCADNFYDLFCGGCAMTHVALLSQKFNNVIFNDIYAPISQLFTDAIHGKYANERRWISREDFYKLRDIDPYVKFVWSFGNNGESYLYSKEIEPWKKAFHYAVVYGDTSLFEKMGIDIILSDRLSIRRQIKNNYARYKEQYMKWYIENVMHSTAEAEKIRNALNKTIKEESEKLRNYLLNALKQAGITQSEVDRRLGTQMSGHYFGKSQWAFPTQEEYEKMQKFMPALDKDYMDIVCRVWRVWRGCRGLMCLMMKYLLSQTA